MLYSSVNKYVSWQHIKKQRHHLANKGPSSQSYGFSSSHVWTVVLKKTLESPLDCMEILPVSPNGNQPWILIGSTDAEAEAPIHWPHDMKSPFFGKDPDAGKDWGQDEKRVTEDETVGWHHWLNGNEFEQTQGDSEGRESLVCCSPRGHKESDKTEQLNNRAAAAAKSL